MVATVDFFGFHVGLPLSMDGCFIFLMFLINEHVTYVHHEPPKPTFLEVSMVTNPVFRWPKPLFFMVLGAHGIIHGFFGGQGLTRFVMFLVL